MEVFSGLNLAAGSNVRVPLVLAEFLGKEDFDAAGWIGRTGLCVRSSCAGGEETRGNDAAVVEDEEVARMKKLGQIAEEVVAVLAGVAVEDEHTAGATDRWRGLCDELFGEIEMEVGYTHCLILVCGVVATLCGILLIPPRGRVRPVRRLAPLELAQSMQR